MKRCLCLLLVCVSFLASFAVLAADPPTKPGVCRCGPACKCNPCACDRESEGVLAANSPLANGVEVAMLAQQERYRADGNGQPTRVVEERFRPAPGQQPQALIEKKQVEGLLTWIGEFVNSFVMFVAFWTWIKSSLWMIPAGLFAIAGAIVLHGAMTKPRG